MCESLKPPFELQRDVLDSIIRAEVAGRAGGLDTWHQILNIQYADTTKMQIVAGIVGGPAVDYAIKACAFDGLSTYRGSKDALRIEVPYLTPKEQRLLNERLPRRAGGRLSLPGVPKDAVRAYAEAYRWLTPIA